MIVTAAEQRMRRGIAHAAPTAGLQLDARQIAILARGARLAADQDRPADQHPGGKPAPAVRAATPLPSIGAQEVRVLRLMAYGLDNAEICRRLGVTASALKGRSAALFRALGADTRAHAVALGYELGLLRSGTEA